MKFESINVCLICSYIMFQLFFSCQYRDILQYHSIETSNCCDFMPRIFYFVWFCFFHFFSVLSLGLIVFLNFTDAITLIMSNLREDSCYVVNNWQIYIKAIACACYLYFFVSLCVYNHCVVGLVTFFVGYITMSNFVVIIFFIILFL